ncbi:hypothetical protein HDU86_003045 [Geranomyces michiganensis]|nr:hypothetical protein HDU86_003045 [Geranomyces michiganensis]
MTETPDDSVRNHADEPEDASYEPRASRDKFRRERDGGAAGGADREEVDEFGRLIDSRMKRERSKSLSPGPGASGGDRRGKRRRSRSREYDSRDGGKDSYIPSYSNHRDSRDRQSRARGDYYVGGIDRYEPRKSDRRPQKPEDVDYLLTLSAFVDMTRKSARGANISQDELERRFEIYKENFTHKQLVKFFDQEKDSEWFREKYHPDDSKPLKLQTKERRQWMLEKFAAQLESGKFDKVCFDEPPTDQVKEADAQKSEDAKDGGDAMDTSEDAAAPESADKAAAESEHLIADAERWPSAAQEDVSALFLRSVPAKMPRQSILDVCSAIEGFQYLVLSDPRVLQNNLRVGWIIYKEGTDMQAVLDILNGKQIGQFTLRMDLHRWQEERPRSVPGELNTPARIRHDLAQITSLAAVLDEENGFAPDSGAALVKARMHLLNAEDDNLDTEMATDADADAAIKKKEAQEKRALDLFIFYLRKVHNYDYYGGVETSSPEDFARRSSLSLRRAPVTRNNSTFCDKLDARIDVRINKPLDGPAITKMGGMLLETELEVFLAKKVKKEAEGKFRCTECSKLFKGEEFVKKHIRAKHPEVIMPITKEVEFFNTYVRDPTKADGRVPQPAAAGSGGFPGGGGGVGNGVPGMSSGQIPTMMPFVVGPNGQAVPVSMTGGVLGGGGGRFGGGGPEPRGYSGGRNGMQGRLGPAPPRRNSRSDPRAVRSYDDLDNPVPTGEIEISYD